MLTPAINHRWINLIQIYFIGRPEQCEKNHFKKEKPHQKRGKNIKQFLVILYAEIILHPI